MITVTFGERELQALLQLMDIAVKTNGLQSAGSAFILQQKLMNAYQATLEPQATVYHKTIDGEFVETN